MRPTKLNAKRAAVIIAAAREGATRRAQASAAGVSERTLQNWLRTGRWQLTEGLDTIHTRLFENVEIAEGDAEAAAVAIWRQAFPTDWRAVAEWLARRYPDRWARDRPATTEDNAEPIEVRATRLAAILEQAQAHSRGDARNG